MITIPISTVNLSTILEMIGENESCWSVLHIWAISKPNSKLDIFELEGKTKADYGYQVDWQSLFSLSAQLDQINECTIIAVDSLELLPDRGLSLESLREICDVVIEAVDSTGWEISVKDISLSKKLKKELTAV